MKYLSMKYLSVEYRSTDILSENVFDPVAKGVESTMIDREPSASVEEYRASLRKHIEEAAKQFKTMFSRELGTIDMTISTAEACGISIDRDGYGEFEGTTVRVRHSL